MSQFSVVEVTFPEWILGGISPPPFVQCTVLSLEGDPLRVAFCNAALTGSRVLILADAWSGMITCR